jgi:hypothetical protein
MSSQRLVMFIHHTNFLFKIKAFSPPPVNYAWKYHMLDFAFDTKVPWLPFDSVCMHQLLPNQLIRRPMLQVN